MRLDGSGEAPKICVIIPVYKTEKYLQGCVDSVLRQNYANLAVILVDDGSPDAAPALCDALAAEHPQVHVVHKSNGGLSSARNAGLDQVPSDTQFVLFLDSDDQLAAEAISGLVSEAVQTGAEIVMPDRYIKVDERTGAQREAYHFPREMYMENPQEFALFVLIKRGRAWRAHSLLYAYDLLKRSGAKFPEGHIAEDISFNLQVLAVAKSIAFYPHSTVFYLKRAGSITTTFQSRFEEDIWYIDAQANAFLDKTQNSSVVGKKCVEALLCRNLVTYIFSIMSKGNQTMSYTEKVQKASALLHNKHAKNVVRHKQYLPWFESRKTRWVYGAIYMLLRLRLDKIAFYLLSKG